MVVRHHLTVTPSAARLTESLRDIGYDFPSAIADLVDNSITAEATRVEVLIEFDGADSTVLIIDDGVGMSSGALNEALRFGSRRRYGHDDLGRYGLGLKTASLSQCRVLTVASRRPGSGRTVVRELDLDLIQDHDEWLITDPGPRAARRPRDLLDETPGTVVAWNQLDRVLPEHRPDGGWARRRFETLTARTADHLSMVFHRYLDGSSSRRVAIIVNGEKLQPWDPFALAERHTRTLEEQHFELQAGDQIGTVRLRRHVLPPRSRFSTATEFERLAGPLKWNRQQGLYVYRGDRLVQWGGWAGLRAIDEHTKLARAALVFEPALDSLFTINVAKMKVSIPAQLRQMLDKPIHEVCLTAQDTYRRASGRGNTPTHRGRGKPAGHSAGSDAITTGLALRSAAIQTGDYDALKRISAVLAEQAPEVAAGLGLGTL